MSIKRKKSPLILNSLSINKITTYDVENPAPGLGQAKECGGVDCIRTLKNKYYILFVERFIPAHDEKSH
jgi:hypothetical protein